MRMRCWAWGSAWDWSLTRSERGVQRRVSLCAGSYTIENARGLGVCELLAGGSALVSVLVVALVVCWAQMILMALLWLLSLRRGQRCRCRRGTAGSWVRGPDGYGLL